MSLCFVFLKDNNFNNNNNNRKIYKSKDSVKSYLLNV
jgi:hypothetical protein